MLDPGESALPTIEWGIDPGCRIWVGGHAIEIRRALERLLADISRPPNGKIDAAFVAPLSLDEGLYFAHKVGPRLVPTGRVWVVCDETSVSPDRPPFFAVDDFRIRLTHAGYSYCGLVRFGGHLVSIGFQGEGAALGGSIG